jgi:hypothetical protein
MRNSKEETSQTDARRTHVNSATSGVSEMGGLPVIAAAASAARTHLHSFSSLRR